MTLAASELERNGERGIGDLVESARQLYCGLLNGRQLASDAHDLERGLSFLVGGVVIETGYRRRGQSGRIVLRVNDPRGVAARCWNAGYTVLVDDGASSEAPALGVIDPFGLRIDLDRC
ncbi:MAG TPA: hypothetical protein VGH98_22695 [Gemmatimonadaceae bacterium]|jgi:hypothetical protein